MSSAMKKGICWALATLQVTHDDIDCEPAIADNQTKLPKQLPLGTKHSPNHQHQQKHCILGNIKTGGNHNQGPTTLIKDAVHSVVDTLFGREDRENVQPRYSRLDVSDHCSAESCWLVINNRVYDATRFLRMHPGGEDIILEYGGHDATTAFIEKGHSVDAFDMLAEYCIGEVIEEDRYPEVNHT
ncbi:hypothetical protein EGW08_005587 [Elysia chlorotica]|uniref:Cytochrome b5 heme-binding domain-containing protein n=1 Tax=Elysia chlorotica TaxID=188477 RepID=A0A3S1BEQ9_ELYCH|nr:hypothetical protein EGW08_005587 [Elysia chlorotica]